MKASDLFLKCLEDQGVTTIFGVPGEENADIMMSLTHSSIQFVSCRHEQSAAFMADMYGRLTGKPGVCLSTLGPGATNMITGVANANMDNVPLIAIVGQASTNRLHKESHQNMNAVEMYKPVTKWAISVLEADVIPEIIYKAVEVAICGRPGAVMIELPEDIAGDDVDVEPLPRIKTTIKYGISSQDLDLALAMIEEAKKPLMLLGSGCTYEGCDDEILEFIEKTNIYAATTFMGKGALSTRHPCSLYCVGLGMQDIALDAFEESDLVICVGYRMVEWHPDRWNFGVQKKIIHIDVSTPETDKEYLPDVGIIGKIANVMRKLNSRLTDNHRKDRDLFKKIRDKITNDLQDKIADEGFPVKPQRILHELRLCMHDSDILISDVGAHKMWIARQFETYQSKTCFIYNGFCSMGGSMPAAIISKWIHPEKNVVALCGDGGFIMSIPALVTAVQYHTPIVVCVWEDEYYGLIKWKQEMTYNDFSHVELYNPDLVEVAKSFGCNAVRINNTSEIIPTFEKAFKEQDKPTVIIIPVDYSENMKLTKRLGKIIPH